MATLDLLALGEAMVEFNQGHADDPRTYLQGFGGDTSNTAIAEARVGGGGRNAPRGGDTSNTATAASRLRLSAHYASRVDNAAFGRWLRELWQRERFDTTGVECV